ncbi:MAG: type II secretion system protein GspG [Myxococcota bacterium]
MRKNLLHQDWRQSLRPVPADRTLAEAARLLGSRRGMSLVEVMVVIAIILTLMGILTWGIFQVFSDSQVDTTKLQMTRVAERIEIHSLRKKLPTNGDGLRDVFGDDVPKDSWGNDFVYVTPGPNGKPFDLISLGADGQEGGTGNDEDIKYSEVH